jgi:hypothetical protein
MLWHTDTSGEGKRRNRAGKLDCNRAGRGLLRAACGLALLSLIAACDASIARAADDDTSNGSIWNGLMQRLGLRRPPSADSTIDYTERPPLVVPRTRDLPPPAAPTAIPAPDWPRDAARPVRHAKTKAVVPDTAVQTPNPPIVSKPWYDPFGLFHKEEYANFPGEPVRQSLTDPPAGYRIPSPNEPYGIGPQKSKGKSQTNPTGSGLGSVTPPSGGQGGK